MQAQVGAAATLCRLDPALTLPHGPRRLPRWSLLLTDYLMLPLAVLPFPNIDPVIVQIGPLAIHWYGVGYVVGILFAWWYAKRIVTRSATLARRRNADAARRHRRFPGLGCHRRRARRPRRLHPILRSRPLHRQSARHLRRLAGRHVVPRRLRRRDARHDPIRPLARHRHLDDVRRHRRRRAGRRSASSGSPTSSIRSSGAGRPTCPGPSSSRMAVRCRAIRASSTKPRSKGSSCSSCSGCSPIRFLKLKNPGTVAGAFLAGYGAVAHRRRVFPRARRSISAISPAAGLPWAWFCRLPMVLFGFWAIWRARSQAGAHPLHEPPRRKDRRADPRRPDRSRSPTTWRSACSIPMTATTRRASRSASKATSSPRPKSARCSAN